MRRSLLRCGKVWSPQQDGLTSFAESATALKRRYRGKGLSMAAKARAVALLRANHVPVSDAAPLPMPSHRNDGPKGDEGEAAVDPFIAQNGVALAQFVGFFELDTPPHVTSALRGALSAKARNINEAFDDRLEAALQQARLFVGSLTFRNHTTEGSKGLAHRRAVAAQICADLAGATSPSASWPIPRTLRHLELMGKLLQVMHNYVDEAPMASLRHQYITALDRYREEHQETFQSVAGVRAFTSCCRVAPEHHATLCIKDALLRALSERPFDFGWEAGSFLQSLLHLQSKGHTLSPEDYLCVLRALSRRDRYAARTWVSVLQAIGAWHRPGPAQVAVTDPAQRAECDRLVLTVFTNASDDVTSKIARFDAPRSELVADIVDVVFQLELDGIHRHPIVFPGALSALLERVYDAHADGDGDGGAAAKAVASDANDAAAIAEDVAVVTDAERRALLPLVCGMVSRVGPQRFPASVRQALVALVETNCEGMSSPSSIAFTAASFVRSQGKHAASLKWWPTVRRTAVENIQQSEAAGGEGGAGSGAAGGRPSHVGTSAHVEALLCAVFGPSSAAAGDDDATHHLLPWSSFATDAMRWQALTPRHVCEVYALACRLAEDTTPRSNAPPAVQETTFRSVAETHVCSTLQQSLPGCVRADDVDSLRLVQASHSPAVRQALDDYLLRCASEDAADWSAEMLCLLPHMRAHASRYHHLNRPQQQQATTPSTAAIASLPLPSSWMPITESVLATKALSVAKRLSRSALLFVHCARCLAQQFPQGVGSGGEHNANDGIAAADAAAISRAMHAFITNGGDDLLDRTSRTPPKWVAHYVLALQGTAYAVGLPFLRAFVNSTKNIRKSPRRIGACASAGSLLTMGPYASPLHGEQRATMSPVMPPELLRELLVNLVAGLRNVAEAARVDDRQTTMLAFALLEVAQFQKDAMLCGAISETSVVLTRNDAVVRQILQMYRDSNTTTTTTEGGVDTRSISTRIEGDILQLLPLAADRGGQPTAVRPAIERVAMTASALSMGEEDDGLDAPPTVAAATAQPPINGGTVQPLDAPAATPEAAQTVPEERTTVSSESQAAAKVTRAGQHDGSEASVNAPPCAPELEKRRLSEAAAAEGKEEHTTRNNKVMTPAAAYPLPASSEATRTEPPTGARVAPQERGTATGHGSKPKPRVSQGSSKKQKTTTPTSAKQKKPTPSKKAFAMKSKRNRNAAVAAKATKQKKSLRK